jgi:hypothetical protein
VARFEVVHGNGGGTVSLFSFLLFAGQEDG